jgi:hypothetical protein
VISSEKSNIMPPEDGPERPKNVVVRKNKKTKQNLSSVAGDTYLLNYTVSKRMSKIRDVCISLDCNEVQVFEVCNCILS